jgi:hypothetical protein
LQSGFWSIKGSKIERSKTKKHPAARLLSVRVLLVGSMSEGMLIVPTREPLTPSKKWDSGHGLNQASRVLEKT